MAKNLKIVFLGGVDEIGKNMTAIEYGDNIILVDCGSCFPTEEHPGVDLIIPDFNYIKEKKDKVKAVFLTHGHEDHIGSVPFLLKQIPSVPIYGTKLTLALLEHKIIEHNIKKPKMHCIKDGDVENVTCFKVEFVNVSHSISGAVALSITTPVGVVFHTGDFKIDFTPPSGAGTNLTRIAEIGQKGVLLMLGESTNVEREGYTMSESTVGVAFDKIFSQHTDKRLIIATFASNVHRLQQIVDIAKKYGRKVVFNGRSMLNITEMAVKIGELKLDPDMVVDIDKLNKVPYDKLVIISTGSQGEPMSALVRMASGDKNKIVVGEHDTVVISSTPIPGNEKMVYNVINNLYRKGADVIYGALEEVHVSGHACKEEIKLMHSLVNPKYFIPVHGEYRHLMQHAELAESMGMKKANIMIPDIGSVIEVKKNGLSKTGTVQAGAMFVDGDVIGDVESTIIKDRKHLSEDGFVIVILGISQDSGQITSGPEIITRGIHSLESSNEVLKQIVTESFNSVNYKGPESRAEFKANIRKALRKWILQNAKQRPMIIPIIMEN